MPGHQRAKNVAYDDDDFYSGDDYYEDEEGGQNELSPEDQEQMRLGTIKVKEALDSTISVTDKQIEEALWNYYYNIGKSVTYLKNTFGPKQKSITEPQKTKTTTRFDQAASAASSTVTEMPSPLYAYEQMATATFSRTSASKGCADYPVPLPAFAPLDYESITATDFFFDVPWGNVPQERLGTISIQPLLPRGRLLGGSSRPSKLAALAAARKRKQEEAKIASAQPALSEAKSETDKAVSLLDRLNVKENDAAPTHSSDGGEAIRRESVAKRYPLKKRAPSPEVVETKVDEDESAGEQIPLPEFPDIRTGPSTFASTLCGRGGASADLDSGFASISPFPNSTGLLQAFKGPSPDDIVLNAQAKGTKPKSTQPKKTKGDKLAASMEKMAVEETPKVKSKNLDVIKEFEQSGMKPMANFVVIGHVDHGKSTLMGRLLFDLKVVDQRSVDKLRKEAETIGKSSFAFAWVMDQTSEERSRGVTVDIATNYFETSKTRFTILDAPGHQDFIPNMIAGASQADFAVLVIDASTNSFEAGLKGQTKEHALLVRSMGVQRLIVAVNKMDTVAWSQSRFNEISTQMTTFLTAASFSLKSLTFIPVAGLTGDNVTTPVQNPNAAWYAGGETLIDALDASEPAKRNIEKPLRLTISDVFRGGITNPVSISGRLDSGSLQIGDSVLCMPANESAVIKGLEVENEPVDWVVAGQIATLHLSDIDPVHLRLGDIVCDAKKPVKLVKEFTAKILAFEHVMPMGVDVFRGRLQAEGKVKTLLAVLNKGSGEVVKKKPRIVKPSEVARVCVQLERELPLEVGTRVVLREGGATVAAGLLEG
ncbi:hypothetical protein K491DRAFT_735684 [Lophiostoma macrostomum CBS 122681]|uniref:Elongation factor 1 alpha-like protein n=1 Tax=Lophiostoma macrostomum CBS 122681 TaxID=1314788 RepID=A0A6A6SMG2_9PLEO|nr:hypothetical protein K491DRAFT_735684 [Lophiostoma macrostomum CBS 122681]